MANYLNLETEKARVTSSSFFCASYEPGNHSSTHQPKSLDFECDSIISRNYVPGKYATAGKR
jgi:hypothetical protein